MLQVAVLRNDPDGVKKRLAKKHVQNLGLVDSIIELDDQRKKIQAEFDAIQAKVNSSSKEIGMLMGKGEKDAAEALKAQVANWKAALEPLKTNMAETEAQLQQTLVQLPNLPADIVPEGRAAEDNPTVKTGGPQPQLPANAKPHWDLAKQFNLIDFELGNKVTGSGFPFYIGKGARLQRALIQYFL
ncbi:MAG TPA: serine--tRNA ligase, partial [Chitinophagaceae bacterium]|nr:serine--tRNA ligase [Chitinophagaceae bacterium]